MIYFFPNWTISVVHYPISIHTMWLPSTTAIHISLPCNQFTNLTISPLDLYFFHFAHKSSIIRENDDSNGNRVLRPDFSQI